MRNTPQNSQSNFRGSDLVVEPGSFSPFWESEGRENEREKAKRERLMAYALSRTLVAFEC